MASADAVRAFLLTLQDELGGFISFERFMSEALYHPEFGYYSKNIRGVGARGDFATSATLSEELGKAIWQWSGAGKNPTLSEIGAGDGSLAKAIRRAAGWRRFFLNYRIHEISAPLRDLQQKKLGRGVTWVEHFQELKGTLFANELVDAFPCRIFEKTPEGWRELAVKLEGSLLYESLRETDLPESTVFEACEWKVGQRVEVLESFRIWLEQAARVAERLLLIDYGGEPKAVYDRRPRGSIRGYWRHQCFTGDSIYARFGLQDLTSDVNFQDVRLWAEALGFRTEFYGDQSVFLANHLGRPGGEEGQYFKVLALSKNKVEGCR